MKHLLSGVAIAAVFAIAAPVWAQTTTNPPSSPAAPPAAAPAAPSPAPPPAAPAPAVPPSAGPAVAVPKTTSAMPPKHHVVRHVVAHRRVVRRPSKVSVAAGNRITEELNREELARIATGNTTPPPATPSGAK